MLQNLNCLQMSVSGCNGYYEFVLGAGAKAKTVTNNLPLLSVLGFRLFLKKINQNLIPVLMNITELRWLAVDVF